MKDPIQLLEQVKHHNECIRRCYIEISRLLLEDSGSKLIDTRLAELCKDVALADMSRHKKTAVHSGLDWSRFS